MQQKHQKQQHIQEQKQQQQISADLDQVLKLGFWINNNNISSNNNNNKKQNISHIVDQILTKL